MDQRRLAELAAEIGDVAVDDIQRRGCFVPPHPRERQFALFKTWATTRRQELWELLGRTGPVFRQSWPRCDDALAQEDALEIPVQVNGKLRARISASLGASQAELERIALADTKVLPFTDGKQVVKVIVVPEKLVNIVVK